MWCRQHRQRPIGLGGAVGRRGYKHRGRQHGSHTPEGRLLTLCFLSPSVVILGFRLHWGPSVQQDVSCLLLMHCCKVFDVHYRLKKRSALCILHRGRSVSSSMVLNIASLSKRLEDVWISSFFLSFPFSRYVLTKKKKWRKKGIFSSIVRSDM
ncbi:unnamed protein product [Pipistrellus nathusii]|uniref:Uncharacterized protein n=1 Tax=Pipistrellus nathusii TaxID=59473 RepID=A0ABP0A1I8_PIPNA